MSVSEITFGVEIKTVCPKEFSIGHYLDAIGVDSWGIDADYSVKHSFKSKSCELKSPVFCGREGFAQLSRDLIKILACPLHVNTSCGLHVHIGFDKSDNRLLQRLVCLVAHAERGLFVSTGTSRGEEKCFCRSIRTWSYLPTAISIVNEHRDYVISVSKKYPTVEFRCFAGTTSHDQILTHVATCVALMDRACRTKGRVTFPRPHTKRQNGTSEVNKLITLLGWRRSWFHRYCYGGDLFGGHSAFFNSTACDVLMNAAMRYDGKTKRNFQKT